MNMHINILERQQLRRDGLSTFHIHNPVQPIFHQKAFSNTAISVQTFSHVRVREFSRIHGKQQKAKWPGMEIGTFENVSKFVLSCTKKH